MPKMKGAEKRLDGHQKESLPKAWMCVSKLTREIGEKMTKVAKKKH